MNIFFDMDYTILSITGALRPGTEEVFQRLLEDGHTLYIWSGVGVRREEVRRLGLEGYVAGVFEKPLLEYAERVQAMVRRGELPVYPDLVVDDYPQVIAALGGVVAKAYLHTDPEDREMERVYQAICDHVVRDGSGDVRRAADPERPGS